MSSLRPLACLWRVQPLGLPPPLLLVLPASTLARENARGDCRASSFILLLLQVQLPLAMLGTARTVLKGAIRWKHAFPSTLKSAPFVRSLPPLGLQPPGAPELQLAFL
jgi:hypothetical protein